MLLKYITMDMAYAIYTCHLFYSTVQYNLLKQWQRRGCLCIVLSFRNVGELLPEVYFIAVFSGSWYLTRFAKCARLDWKVVPRRWREDTARYVIVGSLYETFLGYLIVSFYGSSPSSAARVWFNSRCLFDSTSSELRANLSPTPIQTVSFFLYTRLRDLYTLHFTVSDSRYKGASRLMRLGNTSPPRPYYEVSLLLKIVNTLSIDNVAFQCLACTCDLREMCNRPAHRAIARSVVPVTRRDHQNKITFAGVTDIWEVP